MCALSSLRLVGSGAALAGLLAMALAPREAAAAPREHAPRVQDEDEEQPPVARPESGPQIGFRTGFALPFGAAAAGSPDLSQGVSGTIPLILDVGYRFSPHIYAGGFVQYGFLIPANCPSGASCSGSDVRLGAAIHVDLMPDKRWDPWLGAGVGYEWLNTHISEGIVDASGSVRGWELADLLFGVYYGKDATRVGPFVSFSIGQFTNVSGTDPTTGQSASVSIDKTSLHNWLMLGIGGTYDM